MLAWNPVPKKLKLLWHVQIRGKTLPNIFQDHFFEHRKPPNPNIYRVIWCIYIYIIHIIYTFLVASPALKSKNTPFNPYPSLSNVGQSSLYARDTIIFVGRFQILTCTIILILVGKNTILLVKSKILSVQSTSVGTSTFLLLNSLIFPTKTPSIIGTIYNFTWPDPGLRKAVFFQGAKSPKATLACARMA